MPAPTTTTSYVLDPSTPAVSTIARGEGPARDDVLPARRGRGCTASAQARDAPAGAGDRDARARARRSEVDPSRRAAADADARVGASHALRRAAGPPAGRGAARNGGAPAVLTPGTALRPSPAGAGRGRAVELDSDSGGDPSRAPGGDRRRDHDLPARIGPPRRHRGRRRDPSA